MGAAKTGHGAAKYLPALAVLAVLAQASGGTFSCRDIAVRAERQRRDLRVGNSSTFFAR